MIYFPVRSRCSAAMSDDVERTNDNIDGRLQKKTARTTTDLPPSSNYGI